MTLSREGQAKLRVWVNLLAEQGWSKPDKQWLVDFWLAHHDEDGAVIAKGHPLYREPPPQSQREET